MRKVRKRGEMAVVAVCAVVGFLLALQLKGVRLSTQAAADASAGRRETLQQLYNDELDRTAALEEELARLPKTEALEADRRTRAAELARVPTLTRALAAGLVEQIILSPRDPDTGIQQVRLIWKF